VGHSFLIVRGFSAGMVLKIGFTQAKSVLVAIENVGVGCFSIFKYLF
jgi:hypothetical protein